MDVVQFYSPGVLRDEELELVLTQCLLAKQSPWAVPAYLFEMRHRDTHERMGRLSLRIGLIEKIVKYAGQVGYSVEPPFQGRHFAERAVRLILPLARQHGLTELWITCSPDNIPSRRTLDRLGAQFIEELAVPDDYPLPEGAIRRKCRYRVEL
jgi:tagatose 1,6-diphosphate aldolase